MISHREKPFKKGEKVFRLYGQNSDSNMRPGDVGTVANNRNVECRGVVDLKEFPCALGHDTIRIRRVSDYKGFTPKEVADLFDAVHGDPDLDKVLKIVKSIVRRRLT